MRSPRPSKSCLQRLGADLAMTQWCFRSTFGVQPSTVCTSARLLHSPSSPYSYQAPLGLPSFSLLLRSRFDEPFLQGRETVPGSRLDFPGLFSIGCTVANSVDGNQRFQDRRRDQSHPSNLHASYSDFG